MRAKTVALVVLLIVMAGSIMATSASTITSINLPLILNSFMGSFGNIAVALADPVSGGPGSGGM